MSTDPARSARSLTPLVPVAATALVALLLLVATRYGYHRDELYFVAASRHLAWGYVDQPPFTIAMTWLAGTLFGQSLLGLRLLPALAVGGVVWVTGLITRDLGGGRFAQGLAAVTVAGSGLLLAVGHLMSTATFDLLFWAILLLLVVRLLSGGDPRLWLLAGLVAGVGLLNKHTVLFLLFGLLVGLLTTRGRTLLSRPEPWLGGLVALVVWLPNLVWQVQNDWPTIEMLGSLQESNSGPGPVIEMIALQIPLLSFVGFGIAVAGLLWLLRSGEGRAWRPLGVAYLTLLTLFVVAGGKGYYFSSILAVLVAAGAVASERRLRTTRARATLAAGVAVGTLLALPVALPILPVTAINGVNAVNKELGETVGWQRLVAEVAAVYESVPPGDRPGAVIFTANYGVAGAVDLYGPEMGLPGASSGHNSYWHWGPPSGDGPVVLVGISEGYAGSLCSNPALAARIDNGVNVENDEQGRFIWICSRPKVPWERRWDDLRHYN